MRFFELRSRDRFVIRFAHETASLSSLSCVFVETFEIFIYICAGSQLSNKLFQNLLQTQPLPASK
jgi:hypothetical protein